MGKSLLSVCLVLSCVQLFANEKLLPPPTVQASNLIIHPDGTALHLEWTNGNGTARLIVMRQGSPVTGAPVNGVDYGWSQNFGNGPVLNPGEFVVGNGAANTLTVVNLTPGSTYYATVFEYNGTGAATDYLIAGAPVANNTTFNADPTVQATNVVFSNVGTNSMTVSWTPGNGTGALVVMRAGAAVVAAPPDLTFYLSNPNFGRGTQVAAGGNFAVHQSWPAIGVPNSVTVTNLQPGVTYHVAVFETNGTFMPFVNSDNPARGSQSTSGRPSTPSSNIAFGTVEGNSIRLNWTNGNGARRIVIARQGSAVTSVPVDGIDYNANADFALAPEISAGEKIIFDDNTNFADLTNLQPGTTYHFRIFEYHGSGSSTQYLTTAFPIASQSTLSAPATQSSNINFSVILPNSVDLFWTRGSGTQCIVLVKANAPVDAAPVNLQTYNGNEILGDGDEIGNGNFVILRSFGNNSRMFGVQPGATYHFAIYELNGNTGPVYNLTNPARASYTAPARPTTPASFGAFSQIEGNSMRLAWIRGNGQARIIVARAGSAVTAAPVDGVTYTANANFGVGQEITPGQFVVYDGNDVVETVTNLQHSTNYHYRIYEYNLVNGSPQYLTSAFATGTQATLPPPNFGPTVIAFNNISSSSVNVVWQGGGGTNRMLIARQGSPVDAEPADYTFYIPNAIFGSGDQVGTGNYVVYKGNLNSQTISNLQPGATYHFALYDLNGLSGPVFFRPGITASITLGGPPLNPASSVRAESITNNSLTIRWNNGSGNGRIVLMSESVPVSGAPVNHVEYSANPVFGGGSELRTTAGNFVVYNGIGNTVTVTSLQANRTYHFTVFEYNRFGAGNIHYLASTAASSSATTSAPLPVSLTDFSAAEIANAIKLNWTTAQESNSDHYSIEKSSDGSQFVSIGNVQAAGNSLQRVNYQFIDNDPINGTAYYRLKQVDKDAQYTYSRTLTVQYEAKEVVRKIINPFGNSIFIQLSAGVVPAGTTWRLVDMQGRIVLSKQITGNIINEPAASLRPGMYLLEMIIRGKKQIIKLVKNQ